MRSKLGGSDVSTAPARYFYHTFPRPREGVDSIKHGMQILESIADHGLILTPEMREFRETLSDGTLSKAIQLFQKRACFTELGPAELWSHAEFFGPFSIEWEIDTLRSMGAVPVFYVPLNPKPGSIDEVAPALLARLGEIQVLLTRLESLSKAARSASHPNETLNVTRNGVLAGPTRMTAGGAIDLIDFLQLEHQPIEALTAAIRALCGYFYPVEDLSYTGQLGYYRQREWRIVANMIHLGRDVSHPLTDELQSKLIEMNPQFWARVMQFPTGEHTRAQQSQLFSQHAGAPLIHSARRIVAPQSSLASVEGMLARRHIEIPVTSFDSL